MWHNKRIGFTLMEVLVALMIGALLVTGARGMLDALGGQARATVRVARNTDDAANAVDELRRLVADLVIRRDTIYSLTGSPRDAYFQSYCDSGNGWKEACEIHLFVQRGTDGYRVAWEAGRDTVALRSSLGVAELRYLLSAESGGQWTERLEHTMLIPSAVGIIMGADTLLATVGPRR